MRYRSERGKNGSEWGRHTCGIEWKERSYLKVCRAWKRDLKGSCENMT